MRCLAVRSPPVATCPRSTNGSARVHVAWSRTWSPTTSASPARAARRGDASAAQAVPDALVGLAWPAVFAVLGAARPTTRIPVIEGMLDLVHLDHAIDVAGALPSPSPSDLVARPRRLGRHRPRSRRLGRRRRSSASRRGDAPAPRCASASWSAAAPVPPSWPPRPAPWRARARRRGQPRAPSTRFTRDRPAPHGLPSPRSAATTTRCTPTTPLPASRASTPDRARHVALRRRAARCRRRSAPPPRRRVDPQLADPLGRPAVRPGAEVEITVERTGVVGGDDLVEVTCRADGELAMVAEAVVAPRERVRLPRPGHPEPGHGPRRPRPLRGRPRGLGPRRQAHPRGPRLLDPRRRPRQPDRPVGRRRDCTGTPTACCS